ncbi:hypothetical protein I6I32_04860 [Streptococcus oralis]|mgnify:FL=1|jgi:hypothetical protein|uniref:Uncharacterized protein n=1 Tax=Salmonella enterica subsp. enterica serovar Saintpaul TaxID=90105 RepID=A0A1S0Z963_SALET|nr:hypothetical protein [Streptococcus oralis]QQC01127.1 hypothetical protein I6I32_04860 [Streptococcus oralis]RKW04329.1 MAG: hypothetical protein D8H99_08930 [Streptococcus sp.]
MNTKIRSRTSFPRVLEDTLYQAYQEGKRSVDFLLLFPVKDTEREMIISQVKAHTIVLDAKWRFGTVLFTAYIRY